MRIAILHHSLTGYANSCMKALHSHRDVKIFLAHSTLDPNTPFERDMFSWVEARYEWSGRPNAALLLSKLLEFKPDLLLTLGWHVSAYRQAAKSLKGKTKRILYFENTWRGTAKQWLGVLASPLHVRSLAEYAWVPGSRQRDFAMRLGFKAMKIMDGSLSGHTDLFRTVGLQRPHMQGRPRAFLFVGRLVKVKGLTVLLKAYAQYRSSCTDPWSLICVGAGPLQEKVSSAPGVISAGFLQPEPLAQRMLDASVLVLPSLFEPWGVVVHEAAASGLPIIASDVVGSHVHLVQSEFNGFVVEAGSPESLTEAMLRFHHMDEETLDGMGAASRLLAQQFTPERWAATLRRIAAGGRQEAATPDPTFAA
ncbi:glycosyltransferase family 4 protein [Acidobacteria bacterium AB60]|nr:glycosyltransferase family 4 protein [Acidobacteria bacterium AB60]